MSSDTKNVITKVGLLWLDVLEKEFDKAVVDLDVLLSQVDEETDGILNESRLLMSTIGSTFAQLAHKCLVVFENNSRLEKELSEMRKELVAAKSEKTILEQEIGEKRNQLEAIANTYHTKRDSIVSRNSVDQQRNRIRETYVYHEVKQLRKENVSLRKQLLTVDSELFGARLAAKYLDKELSGRIQQIQLLAKPSVKGDDQERLWNQLEAEIHLHRHKTVVKACRGRQYTVGHQLDSPKGHDFHSLRKRQGIGEIRNIVIERNEEEGLGISITGGKEHGIPILISEIHRNTPASRCGTLYVGDAILTVNGIDLRPLKHADAAKVLTEQKGQCSLQVVYVAPEDEEEYSESDSANDLPRYPFFDSNVVPENIHENETTEGNETDDIIDDYDNLSSITDTMCPSPNKYPGVAKLCSAIRTSNDVEYNLPTNHQKSKETLIE
ncbi:Golgi-associated PDZ and coiled-coil motif-containing protein-like isoform X2 [Leptotrombidium deliense]|uniref:Golgi-associated PDZ and coiled-coil motif-containing protein-like isoform X2 n=1 Tax=Leptotrombidium deliense TaxID=299467 RepID=A0A443SAZ3_9ACAR|nr:Golgi-associated PDZ and coiled-coil motif-containing protein-like isoform X2 [Leptotrombidium deliense]